MFVAFAFEEVGSESIHEWLNRYEGLMASNLVEAEVQAACHRENLALAPSFFGSINWELPRRPLSTEITRVLSAGYLTGADIWHVATALYYAADPQEVGFLTLDVRQRKVAESLGFLVD